MLLAALALPLAAQASGDFVCGMHKVQVVDSRKLIVDGKEAGNYQATEIDLNMNYHHYFRNDNRTYILRETQKGSIALKVRGYGGWASCKPVLMGFNGAGSSSVNE